MAATDLGVNDPNSTVGQPAGTSGVLSEFAGEYVSDMLGKTRALADKPLVLGRVLLVLVVQRVKDILPVSTLVLLTCLAWA